MNIEFINNAYTVDGLMLPMVHLESKEKDICIICIHGMCGTIVDNYFATVWGKILSEKNIGFIYEHNRGHSIENDIVMKDGSFKRCGCMYEIFEDYMYMSSATYYNWYNENSNLDNLPVISNKEHWEQFETIEVPILTFSGSNEEDYYLQLDLLKDKALNCKNFEYKIIENTGHTYKNKELEVANLIFDWINKNF